MKKISTSLACLFLFGGIAYQVNGQEIQKTSLDSNGQPSLISFKKGTASPKVNARTVVENKTGVKVFKEFLKTNDQTTFSVIDTKVSNNFTDQKYQQFYKGIKVEFSTYSLHLKDGELTSINGSYLPIDDINISPTVSENNALEIAKKVSEGTKFVWELPNFLGNKYNRPIGELVILPFDVNGKNVPQLAYKFDIYSVKPKLARANIYISATTGAVLKKTDVIKNCTVESHQHTSDVEINHQEIKSNLTTLLDDGNAETLYSGKQTISTTKGTDGKYILLDTTRGSGIHTFNANSLGDGNTGELTDYITEFTDNDNNWTQAEHANTQIRINNLPALDVHWASKEIYDYWKNVHNRDSFDGKGGIIKSYVHFADRYDNAAWTGEYMIYGDGNLLKPLVSLDISAHEIGHAIATHTADLQYNNENGAINEALSDIWGAVIEHTYAPTKKMWEIGEEITADGVPLRSMSNPKVASKLTGPQPDTYLGKNWYIGTSDHGGVHTNSGVINHFFYILTDGKTGTNDVGNSYNVKGLGVEKAAKIIYRAEDAYLTSTPTFTDFRNFVVQAATDLYGENSVEATTVVEAFYAVNIGLPVDNQSPTSPLELSVVKQRSISLKLSWKASTDNYTVKGYKLFQDGKEIADLSTTTTDVFDLKPGTTYKFIVKAYDQNGNISKDSNELTATTAATSTDIVKPTAPVASLVKTGNDYIDISWTASTDNDEVRGYVIFVDGVKTMSVGNVKTAKVKPVTPNAKHVVYVQAYDFENNFSDDSNKLTTTTFVGEYCVPNSFLGNVIRLNQFTLANIDIPLNDPDFVAKQGGAALPIDYTKTIIQLKAGETYKGTFGLSNFLSMDINAFIWIDYNRDNIFNPFTETVYQSNGTIKESKVYDYSFTVPKDVKLTNTSQLRVGFISTYEPSLLQPAEINQPCGVVLTYGGFSAFSVLVSENLSTGDITKVNNLRVSPNPFSSQLTVESAKVIKNVEIYNMVGLKVNSFTINSKKSTLNVGNIPAGVYILKSLDAEGNVETQKLIKK